MTEKGTETKKKGTAYFSVHWYLWHLKDFVGFCLKEFILSSFNYLVSKVDLQVCDKWGKANIKAIHSRRYLGPRKRKFSGHLTKKAKKDCSSSWYPESPSFFFFFKTSGFVSYRTFYVFLSEVSDHYMGSQQIQTFIQVEKLKVLEKHTHCLMRENDIVLNNNSGRKEEKRLQEGWGLSKY